MIDWLAYPYLSKVLTEHPLGDKATAEVTAGVERIAIEIRANLDRKDHVIASLRRRQTELIDLFRQDSERATRLEWRLKDANDLRARDARELARIQVENATLRHRNTDLADMLGEARREAAKRPPRPESELQRVVQAQVERIRYLEHLLGFDDDS